MADDVTQVAAATAGAEDDCAVGAVVCCERGGPARVSRTRRSSVSALSHHDRSSAAFITNIAESNALVQTGWIFRQGHAARTHSISQLIQTLSANLLSSNAFEAQHTGKTSWTAFLGKKTAEL